MNLQKKETSSQNTQAKLISIAPRKDHRWHAKLILPSAQGIVVLNHSDIIYCQADGNYTTIYCRDKEKWVFSHCLKFVFDKLGAKNFVRVHQSYVVPVQSIKLISTSTVQLSSGLSIPLSRRYKKRLLASF